MSNYEQTLAGIAASLHEVQLAVKRLQNTPEPTVRKLPKPGTIIWVGEGGDSVWIPRVFKEMWEDKVSCYTDCRSSGDTITWEYWEPIDTRTRLQPDHKPGE